MREAKDRQTNGAAGKRDRVYGLRLHDTRTGSYIELRVPMAKPETRRNRQFLPRAQRYTVGLPFRYREAGTAVWHEGRTSNISLSGVLFSGIQVLKPRTLIEATVTLPPLAPGSDSAVLRCRGSIVRNALESMSDPLPVLAAAIADYRLVRRREDGRRARV